MDKNLDAQSSKEQEGHKLRKAWDTSLVSLFDMLLRRERYLVAAVRKNIERVIYLYIQKHGSIVVSLNRDDLRRHNQNTMDEYPNYLPLDIIEFVSSLKTNYGIEGADEFATILKEAPDSYYALIFKYYFWTIVLGTVKNYLFINRNHIQFIAAQSDTYSGYINTVELFSMSDNRKLAAHEPKVKEILKEFVMLSEDSIQIIQQFLESDLTNILQYPTIRKYFDFIAALFKEGNTNPYKLSLSYTLIGNVKNFAFPIHIMPYGLAERIAPLNLNNAQLRAFMFVFWMFVKYAPENLYKVYGETSSWEEKHDKVTPMTKYSSDVLDYSAIYNLIRLEATES